MRSAFLCAVIMCALAHPTHESDECLCEKGRTENVWCGPCGVGYLASVPIKSKRLFDDLDAHGHEIDPAALICPTCIKVVGTGGYCDACHAGFIGRKAYFSKLTYLLARGAPLDPLKLTCETCRKNAKSHGWCDKCRFGLVGNNRFDDHKLFDEAAAQFDRLLAAIELADRCETCPSAMMVDAKCPNCRIDYRDGKPVPAPQSQSDNP